MGKHKHRPNEALKYRWCNAIVPHYRCTISKKQAINNSAIFTTSSLIAPQRKQKAKTDSILNALHFSPQIPSPHGRGAPFDSFFSMRIFARRRSTNYANNGPPYSFISKYNLQSLSARSRLLHKTR